MLINVLVYFYVKTAPSTWNISPPSSPATPIWKLWSCQAYPPFSFKKFVGDWTPQQKWRGSHYISLIYNTYLEPQKLVIFGLQLCPINHKNCRSWNLKTHIFGGKVWHHILKQINHFQWRHEVCPLNQFSCTKFNHLR